MEYPKSYEPLLFLYNPSIVHTPHIQSPLEVFFIKSTITFIDLNTAHPELPLSV
jgi:hypothetical protein